MPENNKVTQLFRRMQAAPFLKDDVVNFIFNNIRNLGLSLVPLVAAKAYVKDTQGDSGVLVGVIVGSQRGQHQVFFADCRYLGTPVNQVPSDFTP